ncbi:MAG: alkaline phosphatase family protein [Actinomycetota bacterium]|nr:alkaline phosphatase family protein [Actinomycetota bacterium]
MVNDNPTHLVLGPLLRHVDDTSAVIWVETAHRADVSVHVGGRSWHTPTFCAHGHHYALVDVDGLEPGSAQEYSVRVDDHEVWPPTEGEGAAMPASRIRTLDQRPLRFVFGSCRTSVPHDAESNQSHGIDVLRAFALRMMRTADAPSDTEVGDQTWPDLVLFLGDQVYADVTSEAMRDFIAARRSLDEPPGEELKDYEEYAHLYRLAWSDPANRWLLATLPSAMIFDDHDIRDDWNTSYDWRREMEATSWWHGRIVAGLGSYWVYQHLGNLSRSEREQDRLWQHVLQLRESGADDITELLDQFAERADAQPDSYRWSYARDLAGARVIVLDSRAARVLQPTNRQMMDPAEADWLSGKICGDVDHLFIATSLPFLLPMGLHEAEAWSEALAEGAWGRRVARATEKLRQTVDLEHWGAFQQSFRDVAAMVTEVADGARGSTPSTVTFLSGDVHHSYLAEVQSEQTPDRTRILQAVCSPIRNPLPPMIRVGQAATAKRGFVAATRFLARRAGVPEPPFEWSISQGPWFSNMLATVQLRGRELALRWETADLLDGDERPPVLHTVHEVVVPAAGGGTARS